MFDYEIIEPVFPGKHVEGWKDTRKQQWKAVKTTLDEVFNFDEDEIKFIKQHIFLADQLDPEEVSPPHEWLIVPLDGWFLVADQSQEEWDRQWADVDKYMNNNLKYVRDKYLIDAHGQNEVTDFGVFGGLEQRMFPYLIRSKVYTDETFAFGQRKQEVRLIPWESPKDAHTQLISRMGNFVNRIINPYTPIQWLHEMFYSTFQYDIDYNESSDIGCMLRFKTFLDCNNPEDQYHINHIKMAQRMIEIFEDEGAPKYIQTLWQKVKDGSVS